jgi:hypothetical protein
VLSTIFLPPANLAIVPAISQYTLLTGAYTVDRNPVRVRQAIDLTKRKAGLWIIRSEVGEFVL